MTWQDKFHDLKALAEISEQKAQENIKTNTEKYEAGESEKLRQIIANLPTIEDEKVSEAKKSEEAKKAHERAEARRSAATQLLIVYAPRIDLVCTQFVNYTDWNLKRSYEDGLARLDLEVRDWTGNVIGLHKGMQFDLSPQFSSELWLLNPQEVMSIHIWTYGFHPTLDNRQPSEPHISIKSNFNPTKYILLDEFKEDKLADILREYFIQRLTMLEIKSYSAVNKREKHIL